MHLVNQTFLEHVPAPFDLACAQACRSVFLAQLDQNKLNTYIDNRNVNEIPLNNVEQVYNAIVRPRAFSIVFKHEDTTFTNRINNFCQYIAKKPSDITWTVSLVVTAAFSLLAVFFLTKAVMITAGFMTCFAFAGLIYFLKINNKHIVFKNDVKSFCVSIAQHRLRIAQICIGKILQDGRTTRMTKKVGVLAAISNFLGIVTNENAMTLIENSGSESDIPNYKIQIYKRMNCDLKSLIKNHKSLT